MNILIPHNWLKEHLDTNATPRKIQKCLSLCGPSVERIIKKKSDSIYDIEVTTNRVDVMSVRGIAREAAAILPEFGINARLKPLNLHPITQNKKLDLKIINDPKLCHRILTIKLENVNIGNSPAWLKDRLEQVDQRPLNNAIDITNYIMWEIGHPIHAFDYNRLTKKTIIIREAKKGEKLTTLDGVEKILSGGEVIFDDGTGKIVDLPGIMGTKNTVVTEKTKNVLLWIESVDAVKIRQASMELALRSQAAILNENYVDTELGYEAILQAITLYKKITGATIGSELVDIYPNKPVSKPITLKQSKLDTYMGLDIKPQRVKRILKNLGSTVKTNSSGYLVSPPTWRLKDIKIPQDIIEEIARIYGYHNLPSVVMDTPLPDNPSQENFTLEHNIKTWLSGWGLQETYTYSMVSKELATQSNYNINNHLMIKNPISDDKVYMRRSLIPSLVEVINENQKDNINIFEMQNVYHPKQNSKLPHEELQLAIATTINYPYIKGILDTLVEKLFIENVQVQPEEISSEGFNPDSTGIIIAGKTNLGTIGKIRKHPIYALKLNMASLTNLAQTHPRYIPAITTPPIIEDLTFTVKDGTYIGQVIEEINLSSKWIEKVELKTTYKPNKETSTTNYTFTITYRDPKKSLTDNKLTPVRKRISKNLKKSFSAKLVGTLS